jgi:hypothetical protein
MLEVVLEPGKRELEVAFIIIALGLTVSFGRLDPGCWPLLLCRCRRRGGRGAGCLRLHPGVKVVDARRQLGYFKSAVIDLLRKV